MKKLIVFIGLLVGNICLAENVAYLPVKDYLPTNLDYVYELKVDKYDKVVLDCLGFIKGMNFYVGKKIDRNITMDEDMCIEIHEFLKSSKETRVPICLELNLDENSIVFSRKSQDCR